jgi:tetratricopeptide (TPR) repeat protein
VAGNSLTSLGNVYRKLGRHAEAINHHRQALTLIREVGDRGAECEILNNLGDAHLATGQNELAITCHQQALALVEDLDQRHELAHAHEGIGHALHPNDANGARDHWRRALEIYDQLGVPEAEKLRDHLAQVDQAVPG